MTKTKLLFVSLLLVFGLAATLPRAFAQASTATSWTVSLGTPELRHEGHAEALGTVTLTYNNSNTTTTNIPVNGYFVVTYSAPIANNGTVPDVDIACSGAQAAALCNPTIGVTYPTGTTSVLQLTYPSGVNFGAGPVQSVIVITVRVDANALALCANVTAVVNGHPAGNPSITQSPVNIVGTVKCGLATTVSATQANVLTCYGPKSIGAYDKDFTIRVLENDNAALTSSTDEISFEPPNYTVGPTPTNGSNILITLDGIPTGVTVGPKPPVMCWDYSVTDANYCPTGLLEISDAVSVPDATKGEVQYLYTVTATNTSAIEAADFGFYFWSKGPLPSGMGYSITATVALVDTAPPTTETSVGPPEGASSADFPWFSGNEATGLTAVGFYDCVTNLLFPFINTFVGGGPNPFSNFGTGIDFANTTLDPFSNNPATAKGSAVPQNGNCTVYFYATGGLVSGVEVAGPLVMWTTPTINAGASYAFDVASMVKGFAGMTGYAIAICQFQNAYGFAEVFDNYGIAAPTATLGYFAYILPDPAFYRRSPAGDGLGEEAIAPININRYLLKLLLKGFGGPM